MYVFMPNEWGSVIAFFKELKEKVKSKLKRQWFLSSISDMLIIKKEQNNFRNNRINYSSIFPPILNDIYFFVLNLIKR